MGGFQITPIVKNLLIINIAIFAIDALLGLELSKAFGFRYVTSEAFMPFQVVTYMFLHGGIWHLFFNMFGLYVFGPMVEQHLGSKKFLTLFMVAGLGAGVLYGIVNYIEVSIVQSAAEAFLANPSPDRLAAFLSEYAPQAYYANYDFINEGFADNPNSQHYINESTALVDGIYRAKANGVPMVGASGSIFGVITAFGVMFPNMRLMLLFPPIPVKAKYMVAFYALYSLYAIWERNPGDNVAHLAHLGGMIFGFFFAKFSK